MNQSQSYDVIIIGAGAAGLMCAIEAGKRGRRTLLLEHNNKVGAKILISGGGRCNFTNTGVNANAYVSENPHFCKSALSRFTADDFIKLVETHGIAYHEKKLGQLFCDHSARQIVDCLMKELNHSGASLRLNTQIQSVEKTDRSDFCLKTNAGTFSGSSLVIATGGLSLPKTGATDFGYRIAKQFGLKIIPPSPALDGFVFSESMQKDFSSLSGISIDCLVHCDKISFRENLLLTHRGLSGPAMLQASLYWKPGNPLVINLLPDENVEALFLGKKKEGSRIEMKNLLGTFFPKGFAERFSDLYFSHTHMPLAQVPDQSLKKFAGMIQAWTIYPQETVGYQKAEVTRGGVDTEELSSKTMESRKHAGLYFIGEVVDITGWLGGYNFQWAWSSGWVAGQYA